MGFDGKSLQCSDCGQQFMFTAGEQESYQSKGFTGETKCCPAYRRVNKERRSAGNSYGSRW